MTLEYDGVKIPKCLCIFDEAESLPLEEFDKAKYFARRTFRVVGEFVIEEVEED